MKFCKFLYFIVLGVVASSCQPTLVAEFEDIPVLEAYLHAGNPLSLKVSKLIPFREDVYFSDMDIEQLQVEVIDNSTNVSYTLESKGEGVYASNEINIEAGHSYHIRFPYNSSEVTATTEIPNKPEGVSISSNAIGVQSRPSMVAGKSNSPVEITWSNPDNSFYLIVVETIGDNPTPIHDFGDSVPPASFRVEPTQNASSMLSAQNFSYYGYHRIILYKIQPEYVLLYQTTSTNSQSISEVHANVNNGFGIFTGLNSDTLLVNVYASSGGL